MSRRSLSHFSLNGRLTCRVGKALASYDDAKPQKHSNYWASTENSRNNAWNVNFNDGNTNGNNKYNGNVVRPCVAHDDEIDKSHVCQMIEAFEDCKRGKMGSVHTIGYLQKANEDLPKLAQEVYSMTYHPTTSTCFLVRYPKLREVFAADFRDRIVHHWVILRLEPIFEKTFRDMGDVSFNCRKGFGQLKAIQSVSDGMQKVSHGYTQQAWVFKGDLVSFFMSIDRSRLWYLLERMIRRRYHGDDKDVLLRTVRVIVYHHPEDDCVINGDPAEWSKLPSDKSLFGVDKNLGGPIGNHTTQQFANYYLARLMDLWVQFLMRGSNYSYSRFVDDFIIVCDDKRKIIEAVGMLEEIIGTYGLKMHKNKRYLQPASHGVGFVGGCVKPHRTYLGSRTVGRFFDVVRGYRDILESTGNHRIDAYDLERMEQVVNSYLGFCVHHRSYRIRRLLILSLGEKFWRYFYVCGHYESIKAYNKYKLSII